MLILGLCDATETNLQHSTNTSFESNSHLNTCRHNGVVNLKRVATLDAISNSEKHPYE